ncbi:MAG: 4-hydroxythreonine-4-phosphate dehydrogenase PdxA, partial [Thiohalocapsa sp.]
MQSRPHRIALTPGEPAGIGPDLCILLAQTGHAAELVAVCDPSLLAERARTLRLPLKLLPFEPGEPPLAQQAGTLRVDPAASLGAAAVPGSLDTQNANYLLDTLAQACDGCLAGQFDAMVTAPVHKGIINDANLPFTGHTEFLAKRCNASPVMMLTAPGLRVALATMHLPLRAVPDALTADHLEGVIRILEAELRARFGLPRPRISVCGLNPHAGEGGHLGQEEIEVLVPVLEHLREVGFRLRGPLPADTAFVPAQIAQTDAVLAMYHDQGLPVLKHLGFGQAVNVTLGLPIVRTSVDHGTALDIA